MSIFWLSRSSHGFVFCFYRKDLGYILLLEIRPKSFLVSQERQILQGKIYLRKDKRRAPVTDTGGSSKGKRPVEVVSFYAPLQMGLGEEVTKGRDETNHSQQAAKMHLIQNQRPSEECHWWLPSTVLMSWKPRHHFFDSIPEMGLVWAMSSCFCCDKNSKRWKVICWFCLSFLPQEETMLLEE